MRAPTNPAITTNMPVLAIPAALRCCGDRSSLLSLRSRYSIKVPIKTTGCPSRRQSQLGSPISASNARAAMTTKSLLPEISTSMAHALKLGSQALQCFRQHRSATDGEPFRNHDALRCRIKPLERRMQQEGAPFIFGETAVFRDQDEIRFQ